MPPEEFRLHDEEIKSAVEYERDSQVQQKKPAAPTSQSVEESKTAVKGGPPQMPTAPDDDIFDLDSAPERKIP